MNFENLPQKKEYFFKEVTSITGVKPYVLRFWESEFVQIAPKVDEKGRKLYSNQDLELVGQIKNLLFEDKLSIPEAKAKLDEIKSTPAQSLEAEVNDTSETPSTSEAVEEIYTGVESRQSLGSLMKQSSAPLAQLKTSLAKDLEEHKSSLAKKQFNDQDVLNLVKTKKKLNSLLSRIDEIIIAHEWM